MKIPIDQAAWDANERIEASWPAGGFRRFALAGRTDVITCEIAGDSIALYPERNSGHRALIAVLGLNEG